MINNKLQLHILGVTMNKLGNWLMRKWLREFVWWLQNSSKWLLTLRPSTCKLLSSTPTTRVGSSEISGDFPRKIYSNISGNLL